MSSCGHGSEAGNESQRAEDAAINRSLSRIKHKLLVMSGKGGGREKQPGGKFGRRTILKRLSGRPYGCRLARPKYPPDARA